MSRAFIFEYKKAFRAGQLGELQWERLSLLSRQPLNIVQYVVPGDTAQDAHRSRPLDTEGVPGLP